MTDEEAILAKLDQILERLDALERVRAEQVVIEGGTISIASGEHTPVLVARVDDVDVRSERDVSIYIGGDLNGVVRTKKGKLKIKAKGDITGATWTADGGLQVTS